MRENENIPASEPYEAVNEIDPISGAEYVRFIFQKPPALEETFRKFDIRHEMPLEIIISAPETPCETPVSSRETGEETPQIESKSKDKDKRKDKITTTTTVKEKREKSSSLSSSRKKGGRPKEPGGAAPAAPQKKRGAQAKNQNARTHGFYSEVLTPDQISSAGSAALLDGLDEEITIMRIKIRSLLASSPDNSTLLLTAMNTLKKMITANEEFKWLSQLHQPILPAPSDEDPYLTGRGDIRPPGNSQPAGSPQPGQPFDFDEAFIARMRKIGVI